MSRSTVNWVTEINGYGDTGGGGGGHVCEWDIHSERQSTITLKQWIIAGAQGTKTPLVIFYEIMNYHSMTGKVRACSPLFNVMADCHSLT